VNRGGYVPGIEDPEQACHDRSARSNEILFIAKKTAVYQLFITLYGKLEV
jgi:hypothetical protein